MNIYLQFIKENVLGQFWVLHCWVLEDIPTQLAPPYCGAGLLQDRVRDCTPPPQVSEQEAHDAQLVQDPSTGINFNSISNTLNGSIGQTYF